MQFIDSHAHLTIEAMALQAPLLVDCAMKVGVHKIINICTDVDSLEKGFALAEQFPNIIFNTAATTPHDIEKEGENHFDSIASVARQGKLVAIGETGLDYHYHYTAPEKQKIFLRKYLHLALECRLPVVIHCREAFGDFFQILDEEYSIAGKHAPGVLHCFTGTIDEARQVLRRGWYLSFSGIVTFKKSQELQKIAEIVPLDQLLIETDTPYLAPQSHRGKSNQPAFIVETAQAIASIRGIELETVAAATKKNAQELFQLPH